jgi:hypothetical protein
MKHSELKQIIKEEIRKVLEIEDPSQTALDNMGRDLGVKGISGHSKNKFRVPGYGELPDLRNDINYRQGVSINLPSISGNGISVLYSKEDVKDWIEEFKKTFGETPKFEIDGKIVKVTNPKFVEKQQMYDKAVKGFGTQGD